MLGLAIAGAVGSALGQGGAISNLTSLIGLGKRRREAEHLLRSQTEAQKDLMKAQADAQAKVLAEQRKNMLLANAFRSKPDKKLSFGILLFLLLLVIGFLWIKR